MKKIHTAMLNTRYWVAITLASVFGTNLGDLYAHESGLGIGKGLALLALLAAFVFIAEAIENKHHQVYYWLVIVLIRTGATNIADWLAYKAHIPGVVLTLGLAALIALFGYITSIQAKQSSSSNAMPPTKAPYWLAMLSAGVFGTVVGDICQHMLGDGVATICLTILLALILLAGSRLVLTSVAMYWLIVAVARTAGTAIGDWFAENKDLHIGLPHCTLLSGALLLATLLFWKSSSSKGSSAA